MSLLSNLARWMHLLVNRESTMVQKYPEFIPTAILCSRPSNGRGEKPPVWLALDAIQVKFSSLSFDY